MIFNETVKWKCLCRFFEEAEKEYYVNELARGLKISPGSASRICRELEGEGILGSQEKGRALFYSLKNEEPLVKRLKSAWMLERIMGYRECWEGEEVQSVALYGSRASGEFISKSDIDILIITNADRGVIEGGFAKMKKGIGAALTLTILTLSEWRGMAGKKDRFYIEVISNHVLLGGAYLVVG